MVNVAVAGGMGHLGRTIAEVLNQNADNEVLVLSRKVQNPTDKDSTLE